MTDTYIQEQRPAANDLKTKKLLRAQILKRVCVARQDRRVASLCLARHLEVQV